MSVLEVKADSAATRTHFRVGPKPEVGQFPSCSAEDGPLHISKVIGSLISEPAKEAAIGRRTPGSTATS